MLGIFAKWPRPGQVKTRLAAATSPEWAAEVAQAFLLDTLHRLGAVEARRVLAFAPAAAETLFAEIAARFELLPQVEGDLGQRMKSFFQMQFQTGADRVVLVGTDSPTLPVAYVHQAFDELTKADAVLGPATDGGYYLIGCRRLPTLFDDIAWSGSRVLLDTVSGLAANDCSLALLPPWYDVDTLDDWWMLQGHLAAMQQSGHDPNLPHILALPPAPIS